LRNQVDTKGLGETAHRVAGDALEGQPLEELDTRLGRASPFEHVLIGAGDREAGALGCDGQQMAVCRFVCRRALHDLHADAPEDAVLRREGDRAFRLDLEKRAAFIRHAVNDEIVQRIAFGVPLKLYPFDPGIRQSARFAAGQHLKEIEGAQLTLNIGSSTPAPNWARTAILLFRFFHRHSVHRVRSSLHGPHAAYDLNSASIVPTRLVSDNDSIIVCL